MSDKPHPGNKACGSGYNYQYRQSALHLHFKIVPSRENRKNSIFFLLILMWYVIFQSVSDFGYNFFSEISKFHISLEFSYINLNFFIVVQVHLSPFAPSHHPPPPCPLNPSPLWLYPCVIYTFSLMTLPLFPCYPPSPLWLLSICFLFQCL